MCLKSNSYNHHQKTSKDRHIKVDGRGRRVRIPVTCTARIFHLSQRLGHHTTGQTIDWLLRKVEPAVTLAFSNLGSMPTSPLVTMAARDLPPPPVVTLNNELDSFSFDFDDANDFMSFPMFF